MTRKDYELIATAIRTEAENTKPRSISRDTCDTIARRMADRLADDNPQFDRDRFLAACGVA